MPGYVLHQNRGYIYVNGPDAKPFLQGLVTNDVDIVNPDKTIYTALLTPQGRYLFDFFVLYSDQGLLLDVAFDRVQDLLSLLKKYKLRSRVEITANEEPQTVACVFRGYEKMGLEGPGKTIQNGEAYAYIDPRLTDLGIRTNWSEEELQSKGFQRFEDTVYEQHRLRLGIPMSGSDLLVEKSIPLECGLDELNAIGWEKGCYLGQELTARTKYRGLVRKRLLPVIIEGSVEPLTPLMFNGEEMGSMRSSHDSRGLALIRLEVLEQLGAEGLLTADNANLKPEVLSWMKFHQ